MKIVSCLLASAILLGVAGGCSSQPYKPYTSAVTEGKLTEAANAKVARVQAERRVAGQPPLSPEQCDNLHALVVADYKDQIAEGQASRAVGSTVNQNRPMSIRPIKQVK